MPLRPTTAAATTDVPPFFGYVDTTEDALCLIEAARRGILPRVTRRLNELERRSMIRSGSVFVFSVEESGIKRWTEGLTWSQSRIAGNFLIYRELADRATDIQLNSDGSPQPFALNATADGHILLKRHGLIKKTITVKIEGSDHHLISYYTQEDVRSGRLQRPCVRPELRSVEVPLELLRSASFRYPLRLEAHSASPGGVYQSDRRDNQQDSSPGSGSPVLQRAASATSASLPRSPPPIGPAAYSRAVGGTADAFYQGQGRKFETAYPALSLAFPAGARHSITPSPTDTAYSCTMSVDGSSRSDSWPSPTQPSYPSLTTYHPTVASGEMQMTSAWASDRPWHPHQSTGHGRRYGDGVSSSRTSDVSAWAPAATTYPEPSYPPTLPVQSGSNGYNGQATRDYDESRSRPLSSAWPWMQEQIPATSTSYAQIPALHPYERDAAVPQTRDPSARGPVTYTYRD